MVWVFALILAAAVVCCACVFAGAGLRAEVEPPAIAHSCACGRGFTRSEFDALPEVGTFQLCGTQTARGGRVYIQAPRTWNARKCGCGSVRFEELAP